MRVPSGSTDRYLYFVAVDSTDLKTRETGLSSFTVYRSRNGAAAAAMTTPTVNETDTTNMPGVYELLIDEDTTIGSGNDEEEMVFHITQASMAPVTRTIELYRPKSTEGQTQTVSAGVAEANAVQISGDSGAADDLEAMLDGTGGVDLSLKTVSVVATSNDTALTLTSVGTGPTIDINNTSSGVVIDIDSGTGNAIDIASGGTYAVNILGTQTGVVNIAGAVSAWGMNISGAGGVFGTDLAAAIQSEANDALVALHLDHLLAADYDPATKPGVATALLNELVESDSGVSRFTANALEQGPVATGFSTHSAADVWASGTRTLTAATNITSDASAIAMSSSGVVGTVNLVNTTTTNTDMRGTDSAFLAASAPTNFSSLVITSGGAADALVQGYMNTLLTETTAGRIAGNFDVFFENADAATTKTVDDVGTGGGGDATAANQTTIITHLTDIKGTGFVKDTHSLTDIEGYVDLIDDGTSGLAKIATDAAAILVDTGTTIPASISALNDISTADVNAQVVDALATDTYGEPGQEAPAATTTLANKIGYLYKFLRNKKTKTASTTQIFADDGTTVDHKTTDSDDGTTYTQGEVESGP